MPFRDAAALHLPVERTEVLYAVATGDVRLWERRIIHSAREHVIAATAIGSSDTVDRRGGGASAQRKNPSAPGLSQPQKQQQRKGTDDRGGMLSCFWSGLPAVAPATSAEAVTSGEDNGADFSQYTGPNFYILMELMQGAMYMTTEATKTDASACAPTLIQRMPWSGDLLTALLNMMIFHGNVPAVGRFLGVLLSSYVMALVFHRCRRDGSAARAQSTEKLKANEEGDETGGAHMQLLQSEAFTALIARLAQIYFPLWRRLNGAEEDPARRAEARAQAGKLQLHMRCLPLPQSHRNPLTKWRSRSSGGASEDGGGGDSSQAAASRGSRSKIIESVFNQRSTRRACVGLRACSDAKQRGNLGAAAKAMPAVAANEKAEAGEKDEDADGEEDENVEDVPLTLEHVQEIVVCIALAELGRLVLLSDVADVPGGASQDVHAPPRGQGVTPEESAREEASDASCAAFVTYVRRAGSASTAELVRGVAVILREVGGAWRRQLSTDAAASTSEQTPPGRGTHPRVNSNHCWVVVAMCRVLKCVSQTLGGVCLTFALEPTQREGCQQPWMYQEKDLCYMNLLLTCLCVAGEQLPPSLAQFALRLTEFTLSDVLLMSGHAHASAAPPPQQATSRRCTIDGVNDDGHDDAKDPAAERLRLTSDRVWNAEARWRYLAASALRTTVLRFMRDCYARGSVVPTDTHARWLSALLRQQVLLWERSLRGVVLLAPHVCSGATSLPRDEADFEQRDAVIAVNPREQPEAAYRMVWWGTQMLLECLCALRDMFAAGPVCGFLRDTVPFVAAIRELGRVLQMVCWIDLDARRATPPGARHSKASRETTEASVAAAKVFPFPVLAATERRFFLGAMLVYGISATADALLFFHAWTNRWELHAGAGDPESAGTNINQRKDLASSSGVGVLNACRRWVTDVSQSLLLPSVVRVLQSIAFCIPTESMLPALLRLNRSVEFRAASHVAWTGDHAARGNARMHETCRQHATVLTPGTTTTSSSAWAPTPFTECLHVAREVMALASSVQQVLLSHNLRALTPASPHDEKMARWMMKPFGNASLSQPGDTAPRCKVLLHIVEGLVQRVPWAGCASAPLRDPRDVGGAKTSVLTAGEPSHADSDALPASPPLFAATYVIATTSALLRFASFADTWPGGRQQLLGAVPPARVRAVLLGVMANWFRSIEDAAFRRTLMREELRLRQRQQPCPQPQEGREGGGVLSTVSDMWDGLMTFLSLRTPQESDAARTRKAEWAAIDTYVDSHYSLICDDIVYMAMTLYALERELRTRRLATVTASDASTPYVTLQRLAQHSLESLLPDVEVPATFCFAPLATCCTGDMASSAATEGSLTGLMGFPGNFSLLLRRLVADGMPGGRHDATGCRGGWEGPPIEGLLLEQASALVRVMAAVAALTQHTTNEGSSTPAATEPPPKTVTFVLNPAALSFSQWRKLCFALHAMRRAEADNISFTSPAAECRFHHLQTCTENMQEAAFCTQLERGQEGSEGEGHRCLACCPSAECEVYLRLYVEAGLALVNRSRMDVLVCRSTTAEERRVLFVLVLVLRRAVTIFFAAREAPGELREAHHARNRHPSLPRKQSRRKAEKDVLLRIAVFAFGVRPLLCAEELLH
ncbi:hypothetical protein TRSC58_04297 [Trypanosoma rangeli SC58]|uniref:Uncharacterized protein n=1 Tax=Trypanosoma rangeli SC58 TaxID=429131 RepID=A0A061IXZ4_TRYRA|nr:hypothetical protein TRSC58_04297 [Trypanosoma rangeli SC58]